MSGRSYTITNVVLLDATDTPAIRKARGAFFTPEAITRFLVDWAVRDPRDRVLEPSAGDAAFLVPAVRRLREWVSSEDGSTPEVDGVEIHPWSAEVGERRVAEAGGRVRMRVSDFFDVEPSPNFDVVVGNPPYIRYQDFSGESRLKARAAAARGGVEISGLASSWAAFVVHSAAFLAPGGRLGFVLPAELLSVNYAGPVRRFLFEHFRSVELVLFTERVFPEAEADVVLLLADGYGEGPTDHARVRQTQNADTLSPLPDPLTWSPLDPSAKWTPSLLDPTTLGVYSELVAGGHFTTLRSWGSTTLGAVTGDNGYFALDDDRVRALGLEPSDVLRLSPPGSRHLRGVSYSKSAWESHGGSGARRWLFRPTTPSSAAHAYIRQGERDGVHEAFKCRVRSPWWRVPLVRKADLFLTYMNADAVRLSANAAEVHHLNSVHGVNLIPEHRKLGRRMLGIASLSAMTLLGAEMFGRAYGGGLLKVEPREADLLPMPSPELLVRAAPRLSEVSREVRMMLRLGDVLGASTVVDRILFDTIDPQLGETSAALLRDARGRYLARRVARSASSGGSSRLR